ncbi:MAG: GNAT family protein [Ignavibacteriales bacterium]|nr:GNAT family protein [Ignavibacteriales bacterium]
MPSLRIDDDVVLKILEPEDAEALFALVDCNRLYLRQWLPWVDTNTTLEKSRLFILSAQDQHKLNFGFQCGIWFRGALAGIIGFHSIDWMNRNVEIGYWLGEKFQGRGIVTNACRTLVDYAFYEYQLNRVQIRCATGNKKSNAIIERLGFFKEGNTRQAEFLYDHYVDLFVYGMTADEWKSRYGQQPNNIRWAE